MTSQYPQHHNMFPYWSIEKTRAARVRRGRFGTSGADGESVEKRNDGIGTVVQSKCPKQTTGMGEAERIRRSSGILCTSMDVSCASKKESS